jgi:hypothetical protein
MQRIVRHFKEELHKTEVDMHEVAAWAVKRGWKLPVPVDPIDRLAKEFSQAAREETRHDTDTGQPYRANHAVTVMQGGKQQTFWVDIDEAPRKHMHKSLVQRREQMVGDALQLTRDANHWNRVNDHEDPIQLPLDFTEDVEWRLNAPDENDKTG